MSREEGMVQERGKHSQRPHGMVWAEPRKISVGGEQRAGMRPGWKVGQSGPSSPSSTTC